MHRSPVRSVRGLSRVAMMAVVVALGALTTPLVAQQAASDAPLKVGVLNLDAVALQSPAGQALQTEIVAFQENLTAEMQARQDAARAIEQQVATADTLDVETQRRLEREYQDALTDFQRFQQDKQQEAEALRSDGLARIQEEIAPVIEQIQVELGYDLVFNSTSTFIVIFSDRVDITQLVIDRLQAAGGGA